MQRRNFQIKSFTDFFFTNDQSMKILYLNARRSLINKMVEPDFILKEAGNNINLIAVTESWFKNNEIQPSYLQVTGFSLVTASRTERSAGGVAIYIRNNLEFAEKYK
jgi:hypothetical protein